MVWPLAAQVEPVARLVESAQSVTVWLVSWLLLSLPKVAAFGIDKHKEDQIACASTIRCPGSVGMFCDLWEAV